MSGGDLTIVMYHYVREIAASQFPEIKGLELEGFLRQLDYLSEHYTIISAAQLLGSCSNGTPLPERSCLLTFDDGYSDHVRNVAPELFRRGLTGAFFPPSKAILEREMLDVNLVHFILASCEDKNSLVRDAEELAVSAGVVESELEEFRSQYKHANRFDPAEVIYFKRLLQHALPLRLREVIARTLFEKHVGVPTQLFADELYMSASDCRTLLDMGMYIGNHSHGHGWLNTLSYEQQREDFVHSVAFMREIGAPTDHWIMCYPYGASNESTRRIARDAGAVLGLSTKVGVANLNKDPLLELPRMDTNDFPR